MREYTTKPVTVLATEIEEDAKVTEIKEGLWEYKKREGCITSCFKFQVGTQHKRGPEQGGFCIMLAANDIYYVDAETFKAKYSKKGSVII